MTSTTRAISLNQDHVNSAIEEYLRRLNLIDDNEIITNAPSNVGVIAQKEVTVH